MSCDTIYLTTYNGPDLFKNFNEIYKCEHDSNKKISELNSNYYNCTDGMSDELRYGIIKYNKKENTFIIISSNRTMIYDSFSAISYFCFLFECCTISAFSLSVALYATGLQNRKENSTRRKKRGQNCDLLGLKSQI